MVSVNVLEQIIRLAEERERLERKQKSENGLISVADMEDESPEYMSVDSELEKLLFGLSFDDVKDVQTIMYLGRGRDYEENQTSDEIFKSVYDSLQWSEKNIEIGQITQKMPLAIYLREGMRILKMRRVI